jgi:pSer/pThr/pTyr-binding forkhead associated (FHA) protein
MTSQNYQLVMRTGPESDRVFELQLGVLTIGRDSSNEITINDSEVSRKHARLTAQAGGYILEDLGSTNGTFVNGQRLLGPHLLRAGELILLGENVSLTFEAAQFDPDATVVAPVNLPPYQTPTQARETYVIPPVQPLPAERQPYNIPPVQPPPQARPQYIPPYPPQAAPPGYYEPVAEVQEEVPWPEEKRKIPRNWLIAGGGCLIVFLCVCVGAAWVFDTLNMYCLPPFDSIANSALSWLYTCP